MTSAQIQHNSGSLDFCFWALWISAFGALCFHAHLIIREVLMEDWHSLLCTHAAACRLHAPGRPRSPASQPPSVSRLRSPARAQETHLGSRLRMKASTPSPASGKPMFSTITPCTHAITPTPTCAHMPFRHAPPSHSFAPSTPPSLFPPTLS
jgi:hypothetical protein